MMKYCRYGNILALLLFGSCVHQICAAVECVGKKTLKSSSGVATSEDYHPNYKNPVQCSFHIEAPKGSSIFLEFNDFDLNSTDCSKDNLRIFDSDTNNYAHDFHVYCGDKSPEQIRSSRNHLYIQYTSDAQPRSRYGRFKFYWTFMDKIPGCNKLKIQGFEFNRDINGNYTRTLASCSGFPIFEKQSKPYSKLFQESTAWFISPHPLQCRGDFFTTASAVARDFSQSPELITQFWEEKVSNGLNYTWMRLHSVKINCTEYNVEPKELSTTALAGIIAGCLASVILVPFILLFIKAAIRSRRYHASIESGQQEVNVSNRILQTSAAASADNSENDEPAQRSHHLDTGEQENQQNIVNRDLTVQHNDQNGLTADQNNLTTDLPPDYDLVMSPVGKQSFPALENPPPY